jgi:hypothetical protein
MEALQETKERFNSGEEDATDWHQAKNDLRKRVE